MQTSIFYMNLYADSRIREKSRKIKQAHLQCEEKYFQDKQVCWFYISFGDKDLQCENTKCITFEEYKLLEKNMHCNFYRHKSYTLFQHINIVFNSTEVPKSQLPKIKRICNFRAIYHLVSRKKLYFSRTYYYINVFHNQIQICSTSFRYVLFALH